MYDGKYFYEKYDGFSFYRMGLVNNIYDSCNYKTISDKKNIGKK